MEELTAELGAAFLRADLELALTPREDHSAERPGPLGRRELGVSS